ncbi:MAG: lysine-2,3-aminomutase-like protein [Alphaproteobacteria bacterium]|nr:lysine-2,3-aminomutase-like protein [Alphaproteobacteria bacterium]
MNKLKHTSEKQENYITQKGGCDSAVLKKKYAVRITDAVKETIQGDIHTDPVAKQYIPQARELTILPQENIDPIGDDVHTPVKGIVHRYPDRVLFKPANICAVYCRYCFRRERVGPGSDILSAQERTEALNYIRQNTQIREVILTGGDPLVLSPRQLDEIFSALEAIEHVQTIRIHTRIPIADPARVTPELTAILEERTKPIYMVVHANHTQEISKRVQECLNTLHKAGCSLLSQSVLLKGVNDSAEILEQLFRTLLSAHVKPYYLHHPDLAPGTAHFHLSIAQGKAIMAELQGRLSGVALPHYMLDIPGGYGKVPITCSYMTPLPNGKYLVKDPKGGEHLYPPEGENYE